MTLVFVSITQQRRLGQAHVDASAFIWWLIQSIKATDYLMLLYVKTADIKEHSITVCRENVLPPLVNANKDVLWQRSFFFLPLPSAEPKGLLSPSCCLHLLLQHLHTGRDIDQVSAVEEGPADQELLEEAIKLEPIHLSVFKSFRLLEATGCILSHPVLAALSSHCKPNHLRESSPFPGCSSDPNPSRCLAPGLGAVQIRGFSRAAFSPLQEPAADSTEVRLSNVVSQQCHVSSGGVISLVPFFSLILGTAVSAWDKQQATSLMVFTNTMRIRRNLELLVNFSSHLLLYLILH